MTQRALLGLVAALAFARPDFGLAAPPEAAAAEPTYKVKVLPDVRVRMHDGVELAVRITRPDAEGKFPAVMSYYPYRLLTMLKPAASEREYSNFVNSPAFLAEHGFVSVNYDVRGTGQSGGSSPDMYSDAERKDGYDMVEWIAAQPWSNGNVGMWGLSYGAVDTWQVAAMAPPHLKAIIVRSGTEDEYRDWTYPGGVIRPWVFGEYEALMAAYNFAPPDPSSTGEKWADIWEEHLKNNVPWGITFLKHQTDDPYWRARSVRPDYDRIKCAVFVIEGWADWYQTAELRAFSNLKVPKRALIGPWGHFWPEDAFPAPRFDARPEYLRWFDQFLKGKDTGVLRDPPVTIFVNQYQAPSVPYKEQVGFWRSETQWPLARTRDTPMYLAAEGRLEGQPAAAPTERDSYQYRPSVGVKSGILAGTPWRVPLDQRQDETYSLTYTSAPLSEDLEVTGNPTADLFVSSTAEIAYFAVKLCDVAPDGSSTQVDVGGLNATHRASDARPEPLRPGEVYELKLNLKSIAYVFPAGHRIRVDVSSADFQNAWPVSQAAVNSLVRGAGSPSRVMLPVAPTQAPRLATPVFPPSPNPLPSSIDKPEYSITQDLINQTTTLSYASSKASPEDTVSERTTYTVSDLSPADAVIKNTFSYLVSRPDALIKVEASTVTASDAKAFRHVVDLDITVNGQRHFNKSWTVSVPRVLN